MQIIAGLITMVCATVCLVGYLGLLAAALSWRFRPGAWKRIELTEPKLV